MPSKVTPKRIRTKRIASEDVEEALLIRGSRKDLKAVAQRTEKSKSGKIEVIHIREKGGQLSFYRFIPRERVRVVSTFGVSSEATRSADADEIIERVTPWAGSKAAATRWFRAQPLPALGDRTAEALVRSGHAALVRRYLDGIAAGGFA